jgi:hypothetical protein
MAGPGKASSSSDGISHLSEVPMYFSISGITKDSSSHANEMAVPFAPALPVLPIRCT